MTNFQFLADEKEYALFGPACIEAERVFHSSPAMCAVGCRKALELGVKWVYAADNTIQQPYRDNLQSLVHEPSFRFALDSQVWGSLQYLIKLGNLAVHTEKAVAARDAVIALRNLFGFVQWIDYCYGAHYTERQFDEALLPQEAVALDPKKIKSQASLLAEKDSTIQELEAQIAALSAAYTAEKSQHQTERAFTPQEISEYATRKCYIDLDLKFLGWTLGNDVQEEFPVTDMEGHPGQQGFVDYVLFGRDGLPLALIEAKRTSRDPLIGKQQAKLYADCLERRYSRRPMIFLTNGFETRFWDDASYPERPVSGLFSKGDLEKLMARRTERRPLDAIPIDDHITDRVYQKEAIRAVCDHILAGHRKSLLVMATGTGKTRTASSLTDVLSRGGYITNVLFLADRVALVKQAKDDFKNYLPDMSLCNLLASKDDKNARIVFSTYPTILNAIDTAKSADGLPLFTPAHFDLIIVDEAHRSIFKKYRVIFQYFDALLVGLTATPKTDVDRNTYDFFETEHGVPTYAYDYDTAVTRDHVLVPYGNIEVQTRFLTEGIHYDELPPEDRERYEDDFTEDDGGRPDFVPSAALNKFVFNEKTVNMVLEDLMQNGIHIKGGDCLGKTIIFAQNKAHAQYIVERFAALWPKLAKSGFIQRVVCDDTYAQSIIDAFKLKEQPVIAVSVDMLDTGIDVPACVNLVFFKRIHSKTKFWQMIGRGTRLCPTLELTDGQNGEYTGKRYFYIFDYCGNFEYFRQDNPPVPNAELTTLSEAIFCKRTRLARTLQNSTFAAEEFQQWRRGLTQELLQEVQALDEAHTSIRLARQHVEKYRQADAFMCLTDSDEHNLCEHIAPLITLEEPDEYAKRFDNFIYSLMLDAANTTPEFTYDKKQLRKTAGALCQQVSIPQVRAQLPLLQRLQEDAFWQNAGLLNFEAIRLALRNLIQFLPHEKKPLIYTSLKDSVQRRQTGEVLPDGYATSESYRQKVNRYIEQNKDSLAIRKLRQNLPLSAGDYQMLTDIFTKELGSAEDYKKSFGDTAFGLLIRRIAKLDHQAAMQAFSAFINEQNLNQPQIVFVNRIIDYIEQNGYMDSLELLTKPPFDKPISFVKLFDRSKQQALADIVKQIKKNATVVA